MNKIDEIDYFTDPSLVENPHPYFRELRAQSPVVAFPERNMLAVTGHAEAVAVLNDGKTFSSANAVTGPIPPLPFAPASDDITPQIEEHRGKFPFSQLLATMDDERHSVTRSLLLRLFTPSRLRANEEYMRRLADEKLNQFAGEGRCEFYSAFAHPFAALVIADLLGVPEQDRYLFWAKRKDMTPPSAIDPDAKPTDFHQFVADYFARYLEDRKHTPGKDIFSEFAAAKRPDGSPHAIIDVINLAVMLFGAGQGTTAHFLSTSLRILAENPDLQQQIRANPALIPDFIEEGLRYDGPIKNTFRLARKPATVGERAAPVGTCIMVANSASNRDPRQYEDPEAFKLGRPHIREHLAFGRGAHTCPGAALARAELRISLEHILRRLRDIRISDAKHGPAGARKYDFEPTYLLRGLRQLHLEFTPA